MLVFQDRNIMLAASNTTSCNAILLREKCIFCYLAIPYCSIQSSPYSIPFQSSPYSNANPLLLCNINSISSLVNRSKPKVWYFQQGVILLGLLWSMVHTIIIHYHKLQHYNSKQQYTQYKQQNSPLEAGKSLGKYPKLIN